MDPLGTTRSRVSRDHALIAPDSHVRSPLPGWSGASGVVLIAPRMGARFAQYLAFLEPARAAGPPLTGFERMAYVLEGEVVLEVADGVEHILGPGGFVYLPPGIDHPVRASIPSRLIVFEKRYLARPGLEPPRPAFGREQDVDGEPFQGDPDVVLKTLLPDAPGFDLAVNLFTFRPGASLPNVEVHGIEHGLMMVEGQGVCRLGESYYPVREGDALWMAPFCPRWFAAIGKAPARYLCYKDVNRDPPEARRMTGPDIVNDADG